MKFIIFSDSHGNLKDVFNSIDKFKNEINHIIHLGDFFKDAQKIKKKYPDINVFCVAGNNDFLEDNHEVILNFLDKKLFLTHGHLYNVYFGLNKLFYKAKELNVNICLFGHTHVPCVEKIEDVLILNPGSISYPRSSAGKTFAILEIKEQINVKIYNVEENKINVIKEEVWK